MTEHGPTDARNTTTWNGARRHQLRQWKKLSVAERLQALDELAQQAQALSAAGRRSRAARSSHEHRHRITEEDGGYGQDDRDNHRIELSGCQPIPLASYLKALGVLRIVAEQADPEARGCWQDERFPLETRLDADALRRFFLDEYRPTPILAPWNGGSGFYAGDNQSGIGPISASGASRFASMRRAITVASEILERDGLSTKPSGDAKTDLLMRLRSELDDDALGWLDAAVVLSEDTPKYPPLLGTGGNDGRLDFTNNFMQRLVALFDPDSGEPAGQAGAMLEQSLFDSATPGIGSAAVGQFAPGAAGGPNQAAGFEAQALVNPWDFVLMLEGALLFAAAATRRLESTVSSALSYPFTVRPTGAGSGATAGGDEGAARAELWAPLWRHPAGLAELKSLLCEGRATIGRRPAVDGLDFARAVARLGVDRGIEGFQRYAFLMRSGKAYFATPLNRVTAARNPAADLVDELDQGEWLARFRRLMRKTGSNRLASLGRRLENAIFALTQAREHPSPPIENVLGVLGEIQLYMAHSPAAREACPPVPWLSAAWLARLEESGDAELHLAAAVAGLYGRGSTQDGSRADTMPMRAHLAPERYGFSRPDWSEDATHRVTWTGRDLHADLIATLERRLLEAARDDFDDKPLHAARTAPLAAVADWLNGVVDEKRVAALIPGLALVKVRGRGTLGTRERTEPVPAAYRILKPFFCTDEQLVRAGLLPPGNRLSLPAQLQRRLASGELVPPMLDDALRRLRSAGLRIDLPSLAPGMADGRRLLAALLVPIPDSALDRLIPRRSTSATTETTD